MFIDDLFNDNKKELTNENLRKWFKEKWVRFGPDGKIRGDCARGDDSEGKPKCLPQAKAHALGKKGRKTAASRKRREDPNPERSGPAINVKTKESLAVIEGTESRYIAARYIDEFADGDYWYVKGTPDVIKKFVLLANSLEDEAVKGTEYEPDKGMMAKVHAQLGDDSVPQWTVVKAQNLEQLKPIGNRVLQLLMKPDLSYGAQEFMSEFLWTLEEKGLALVTTEPVQGVAEDFTDDLDNIYAMHPQPEKSEQVVFLITGMTEDEFSNRWTDLPDPYQQEFGHDLPLWDADDLSSYPNLAVKRITFDQYVQLVGNYIKSEEIGGSALSRMKKDVAEGRLQESAIFLNPQTVIVGQEHGKPLNLSPQTLKKVKAIAAEHGAWYEGNGADRAYTKGHIDNYVGSFDDEVAKNASPNDPKWLYVLFSNVDVNNRVQRVGVDPKDTIFNRLLANATDNSFQGIGFTSQALKKFLEMSSEGKYDFVKMSQQPATQENLTRFLKTGEALMWPDNWEQYPNKAGKIAKAATVDARDQYLASRESGVYVVGSGHLKAIQQISGKQSVAEEVTESRGSLFSWLKQQFPTWPDYVVKDFLYQQAKTITSQEQLADFLEIQKKDFGKVKWRLEKLPITLDIFTPKTQRMIASREGGSSNPFKVPKDAERHAQQLKMIQQHGVRTEPIIVAKLSNGYDLIEGWHRTIQHLKVFPEGYTGPAWVGYGATYNSEIAEQGVAEDTVDESSIPVYKSPSQFYAGGKTIYKLFRNAFPNLPEHVANDIYNQTSPGTNDTIVNALKQGQDPKSVFLNYYSGITFNFSKDPGTSLTPQQMKTVLLNGRWGQKILTVNPADFAEHSRNRMVKRNFGINPDEDPNRIQRQQSRAKGDGSNEPVIIIQTSNGLILWEGFHRTMSILALGKNGEDPLRWNKVKLRAWVVEIPNQQGVAEGSLNEFVPDDSDDLEDPFDNYPCYDCGSTIFLHHTKLCDLAEPNAVRDLPAKPGSQHWTGEIPKGLRPILGLGKGMSEGEFDKWGGEIKTPSANWKKNLKQPTSPAKLAKQQAANRQRKQQSKLSDELRQLKNQGVAEDKRIARKPGQPVGSKSHSDLYTDENPKGTIQGLKFATAADATASVSKIRNSGRSHAHKIQAAVAMEQRARAAGKIEAAGVYRKFINSEKRTTNEETKNNRISPTVIKRIQHLLNTKFEANLDVDGILGPLTIATIKKFIPKVNKQLAPEPNKTTAIQGKQTKSEDNLTELAEACWKGYHKEGMKTMFGKRYPNCVKNTNEELVVQEDTDIPFNICPGCGGDIVHESLLQEKQDACYHKVKSRYKVWPSAYASGALVQCRKRGAKNWGTKSESIEEAAISTERYTLYINGNPAAYYTDEVDAMTALKELKTAYPKTKIQIMRQECKDEPWSKIMESAQVEAWGLRYNPKTERKEYWKKVFDNQQLARAFVDKFNFELLGLIPVQDKTTNSNYIKENNNRFYFDVGKSTSATDLRNKFHLRHDSNGWYLREGQENFKQYLRNAMKTFTVIK